MGFEAGKAHGLLRQGLSLASRIVAVHRRHLYSPPMIRLAKALIGVVSRKLSTVWRTSLIKP